MNDYNLRDLTMAGVQWEITDMPFVLATAATATATESTHPTNNSAPTRTQTSIVPPIAPTQPLSVDTAVAMAARPTDMDALCRMIAEFNHPLRAAVTNVVLPHRAPNPNGLVIITDIPGTDDDATGCDALLDEKTELITLSPEMGFLEYSGAKKLRRNRELQKVLQTWIAHMPATYPMPILHAGDIGRARDCACITVARTRYNDCTWRCHPNYADISPQLSDTETDRKTRHVGCTATG